MVRPAAPAGGGQQAGRERARSRRVSGALIHRMTKSAVTLACCDLQQTFNRAHNRLRAVGERGNSLLKTTFKALRNVSLCPWKIGNIVAAALVVLHIEHDRTT